MLSWYFSALPSPNRRSFLSVTAMLSSIRSFTVSTYEGDLLGLLELRDLRHPGQQSALGRRLLLRGLAVVTSASF